MILLEGIAVWVVDVVLVNACHYFELVLHMLRELVLDFMLHHVLEVIIDAFLGVVIAPLFYTRFFLNQPLGTKTVLILDVLRFSW